MLYDGISKIIGVNRHFGKVITERESVDLKEII